MTPKRFSYLMTGVVVILCIGLVGLSVVGHNIFTDQADKLSGLKAQNQALKEQQISLAQAKVDIEKYTPLEEIAKAIVPQDKDQAKTIREINTIAAESGVQLQRINFDESSLGQIAPRSSGGENVPKTNITQVKPVSGINGVYSLTIDLSTGTRSVSYYQFLQFLEKLESNRRTAHVSNITITPTEGNRNLITFSLTLNAYLKPQP